MMRFWSTIWALSHGSLDDILGSWDFGSALSNSSTSNLPLWIGALRWSRWCPKEAHHNRILKVGKLLVNTPKHPKQSVHSNGDSNETLWHEMTVRHSNLAHHAARLVSDPKAGTCPCLGVMAQRLFSKACNMADLHNTCEFIAKMCVTEKASQKEASNESSLWLFPSGRNWCLCLEFHSIVAPQGMLTTTWKQSQELGILIAALVSETKEVFTFVCLLPLS